MVGTRKKSDLMLIPESILKKRHDLDDLRRKRAASAEGQKTVQSSRTAFYAKKPESFLSRGRNRRNHATRLRRVAKKGMQKRASNKKEMATKVVEQEGEETTVAYQSNSVGATMVFCVRIAGDLGLPKKVLNVLKSLRLQQQHQGVFLKYDESTRKKLHLVEPFVVYGPPSTAVVMDLIERRGHGLVDNERVPLSDNTVIEKSLGDDNMICTEDLVHELTAVGENFQAASNFLAPFELVDIKSYFERRTLKLKDGKDYGDQGEAIDDYIKQVL